MPVEIARHRFDVDEYHRMAEAGILARGDRVELIDGEIVAMTPIGPRHNAAVNRANRALVGAVGDLAIVQVQGSVRLDRSHEPQPDLLLLCPAPDFYASRLPGPADVLLVIEIGRNLPGLRSGHQDGRLRGSRRTGILARGPGRPDDPVPHAAARRPVP